MFDNQQAGRADERSRTCDANVCSGVSSDLQWTVKDYLNPSHQQQAVTQAVDATIPLDPELCGPPEQPAGPLQMPQGPSAHLMNRDHWERMGFAHSDNGPATTSSTDSHERKAFWESIPISQPRSPGDEVHHAHILIHGDYIPGSTSQLCQNPGPPPQPGHTSDDLRGGGSHSVRNESWYENHVCLLGYPSTTVTEDHHISSVPCPVMGNTYSETYSPCPPRSLGRSPRRESPASEDMKPEGKPSYVLRSPEILQVLDLTPTIQGSAPSPSVAQSPSGEEKENIVQPTQGSGDGLEYIARYYLRPRSRPARCRRRPTGGRSLSSHPQPIDESTAILPLPYREEDNSATLRQSGRRKRKVGRVLGSKREGR